MTRRFWAGVMVVSLFTTVGGAAYLYKAMLDKSTVTVPLKQVAAEPPPAADVPAPIEEAAAATEPTPAPTNDPVVDDPANIRNIQFVYNSSTAKEVSIIGRNAQGVRLVRQEQEDKLAAITPLAKEDDEANQEELPLKK
jgi:hypothetical protein